MTVPGMLKTALSGPVLEIRGTADSVVPDLDQAMAERVGDGLEQAFSILAG